MMTKNVEESKESTVLRIARRMRSTIGLVLTGDMTVADIVRNVARTGITT